MKNLNNEKGDINPYFLQSLLIQLLLISDLDHPKGKNQLLPK